METAKPTKVYSDKKIWFSMWFLSAIITFGLIFFPMFYRMLDNRNKHFLHDAELEQQIEAYMKSQGKEPPKIGEVPVQRNAKAWTVSIILIVPAFFIIYLLSKDLVVHEQNQDTFLASAFPQRMFMPQSVPIKTYVLVTIFTLGVGGVYWLYKVVNLYNAHYKAQLQVEKEIARLMGREKVGGVL